MASTNGKTFDFEVILTHQGDTNLYVGVARAKDLIRVTNVDYYNPKLSPTDEGQGYQRPPEKSRITAIGRYLMESGQNGDHLFPTAVLLAARAKLEYDRKRGTIEVSEQNPLQIVDGQHRLRGLKHVIEKGEAQFEDYSIPFVVIETPDRKVEMTQFRVVNGTAKQVRTDLVNMILTATYAGMDRNEVPKRDYWRIVVSNAVDRLAKDAESPWRDMITLPGESTTRGQGGKPVRATSLITSLRPVYVWLKETSGILDQQCRTTEDETDYLYNVVGNYWEAIRQVMPKAFEAPEDYVVQKTPGVFSLHLLLRHLLANLYQGRRRFDTATFVEFLQESPEITDPEFWHKDGNGASVYGSMKGFQELYEEILSVPYRLSR